MCGRKTLTKDAQAIIEELLIDEWDHIDEYNPSYNIAPTQNSPILIFNNKRKIEQMRWGLIPSWAKNKTIGANMINARGETLLEKPSFKNLVISKRCVVITDGYFEWQNIGTIKTPHYFHGPKKKILPMAGLWDEWKSANGDLIKTYTVITTTPKPKYAYIHNRMPVILPHSKIDVWINTRDHSPKTALSHLLPFRNELDVYPVSTFVNSPKNNSAKCITPFKEIV